MAIETDIQFEGWTLRRPAGELVRGGFRIRLQDQPLAVLEALLERPGQLVTRDELIARLWPNGVVVDFDTALNSAVRRLRIALDDHADRPRCIETIPRRGYRFIGRLEPAPVVSTPIAAAAVPSDPVAEPAAAAVPAPAAARAWRHRVRPALAAMLVLALVAVVLPATVQDATARRSAVARSMPVTSPVKSPVALERYERARFLLERRDEGDMRRALQLFQEVLRLEPDCARAWSGIASVHWLDAVERRTPLQQGLAATRAAAERALALDPGIAEAHLRLANYHGRTGNAVLSREHRRLAAAVEPDDPLLLTFLAGEKADLGQFDEAIALHRRALQAAPLSPVMRHHLTFALFRAGRYEEARAEITDMVEIGGRRWSDDVLLGQTLLLAGEHQAALDEALGMPEGPYRQQILALAYHALGRESESDAALAALVSTVGDRDLHLVAEVHAYRRDHEAAFRWLRTVAETYDGCGSRPNSCYHWVLDLPLLQPLRDDPRWREVVTAMASPVVRQARL